MSTEAPWVALSIDFVDSSMFEAGNGFDQEATHGEVLAWVCLLCWAKAFGRGGRVRVVKSAFAGRFRLSMRSVDGMLARAQKCAAIETDGDYVTLCNWSTYQGKGVSAKYRHSASIPEKSPTKHQPPSTDHQAPPPTTRRAARASPTKFKPPSVDEVARYCAERNNSVDAQRFVDFYSANGWVQNRGKPIVDWRAAVRTWEQNQPLFSGAQHGRGQKLRPGSGPVAAGERGL